MAQFFVRSFPQPGFNGVFTPGRFWPSDGIVVEVATSAADPEIDPTGPVTIGRDTLQMLQEDKRFAVGLPPAGIEEIQKLADDNAALKARVAELEAGSSKGKDKGK